MVDFACSCNVGKKNERKVNILQEPLLSLIFADSRIQELAEKFTQRERERGYQIQLLEAVKKRSL